MNQKMDKKYELSKLDESGVDRWTTVIMAGITGIPVVGGPMAELIGSWIPNQRMDRVVAMIKIMAHKIDGLEEEVFRARLSEEGIVDLLEQGIEQAARSSSEERREYIASIIANSLKSEDLEAQESKYLLRLLDQINDIEVIWLKNHARMTREESDSYYQTHIGVLRNIPAGLRSSVEVHEKAALQKSYKLHLSHLGLLEAEYDVDFRTRQPVFERSGVQKVRNYHLTKLGSLLLRVIGQLPDPPKPIRRIKDEEGAGSVNENPGPSEE